jgi:hypothetical protein
MKRNIGTPDKVIRYVAAIVIFGLGLYFKSWWGLIGFVPLLAAISGWCPPYAMLGINTCGRKETATEPPAPGVQDGDRDGEV